MERRKFLKDLAAVAAAARCFKPGEHSGETTNLGTAFEATATSGAGLDIEGHTQISEFKIDATRARRLPSLKPTQPILDWT